MTHSPHPNPPAQPSPFSPPPGEGHKVLVVDDDPEVAEAIGAALETEGYRVHLAYDGAEALQTVGNWGPDAVLLDLLMPRLDGLAVCRRLRALGDRIPILVVTARDRAGDRVDGLDAGADDYLSKPFDVAELLARLRALVRRAYPEPPAELTVGDLSLRAETRSGRRAGRQMDFTRTEYAVLDLLMRNAGNVVPRDVIMDHVWGWDFGPAANSLEVYIGYLRRKLEAGGEPRLIHTVRGVGYRLDAVERA
ncbi:response regulator transcription factor [Streptomyces sp. HNM0574]|uniref:response regulator transcription factor n=1 Tax=Streptomyces sp. HNM0574 TaxID=2714954 RepID=UPI00146B356F|nr:response regulator transcription factor [Streptomyces sp. HNM0574]NLU65864.1 response regulator transcription factor [Streptomyces sp. HNM0574]